MRQIISELDTKADDIELEGNELQLMSKKKGIGSKIRLTSGGGDVTSITNQEIDEIMKGE